MKHHHQSNKSTLIRNIKLNLKNYFNLDVEKIILFLFIIINMLEDVNWNLLWFRYTKVEVYDPSIVISLTKHPPNVGKQKAGKLATFETSVDWPRPVAKETSKKSFSFYCLVHLTRWYLICWMVCPSSSNLTSPRTMVTVMFLSNGWRLNKRCTIVTKSCNSE